MKQLLTFCLTGLLLLNSYTGFSQQIIWEKSFGYLPNQDDAFIEIRKVNDTTVIAGGVTGNLPYKSFYTQYHTNGTLNWFRNSRTLKTAEQDIRPFGKGYFYGSQVPVTSSGQLRSVMLQRLGPLGDTLWTKVYSAYKLDVMSKLLPTHNAVYIAGHGLDTPPVDQYYFLIKTDTSGTLQWRKKYRSGTGNDYLCDMLLRPNGNIVLSGVRATPPHNKFKLWLVEVNPNGDSLRSNTIAIKDPAYKEYQNRIFNNITLTSDGNYLCSSNIDSAGISMSFAAKIDTSLNLIWARIVRPAAPLTRMFSSRVKELPNGNYALLTMNETPLNNQFYMYTLSPGGQVLNKTTYSSAFCNEVRIWSWEPLPDGGGIVAGRCYSNGEAYIARFGSLTTGIKEETAGGKKYIGQLYPNPAQTEAVLSYNLPLHTQKAAVTLSDLAGRIIGTYPIPGKGTGEVQLTLQAFKSGLYNCTLLIDGRPAANRKLSVIR